MAVSERDMCEKKVQKMIREISKNIFTRLAVLEKNGTQLWVSHGVFLDLLTDSEVLGVCSKQLASLFAWAIFLRNLSAEDSEALLESVKIELQDIRSRFGKGGHA